MEVFYPKYFDAFTCLAGNCPDSCCKEWDIDIDSTSADFFRNLSGPLGDRLRQVLKDTPDGTVMVNKNGRCPMWRQDGLCEIQCQLGHDALCHTCREYPRLLHDYGTFAERGLELSCPEAARLIFQLPHTMTSVTETGDSEPDYDEELMAILLHSRQTTLSFLEESALPLSQKLAVLLLYAHDVQSQIDGGPEAELTVERNLADAKIYALASSFDTVVDYFLQLEILTPRWQALLKNAKLSQPWQPELSAFVSYGIYRYWLQAVSDYDLVCRVKFIIISCILIHALGGNVIATAQLFSKEIENNLDNVEAILDSAYTSPALTDGLILGLLLLP